MERSTPAKVISLHGELEQARPAASRPPGSGGRVAQGWQAALTIAVGVLLLAWVLRWQAVREPSDRHGSTGPKTLGYERVVGPGETLWDVAVREGPAGADPRWLVESLRRANGIEAPQALEPGRRLWIPWPPVAGKGGGVAGATADLADDATAPGGSFSREVASAVP
ncbi:MAG: LysM peptidoglycan-binding domain-containing protein [Limnochordaceae bacterium]|nr:LysM peptidoglycan-binding domain-containing protein [Limnochordaceae bacterium]